MFLTPEIVSRLLRETPGMRTDPAIYYFLAPVFSGYFAYLRPKEKGIEISDVLLIWEDVCFLIEAKTRESSEDASRIWIKDKIEDGIDQINNRAKMLKSGGLKTLRNKWTGESTFKPSEIDYYYGIIILQHNSDCYDPRDVALDKFRDGEIPIQVFSLADFYQLLRFINTPIDFLVYYELRSIYGQKNYLMVHDEFNTYKGIIFSWCDIAKEIKDSTKPVEKVAEEQEFLLSYTKAILRTNDAKDEYYKMVAFGLLMDLSIISLCQNAPRDQKGNYVYDAEHEQNIEATRYMVELSRQRRCVYGEQWYLSASNSLKTDELHFSHGYSPTRHKTYIFISLPEVTDSAINFFASGRALEIMYKNHSKQCIIYAASTLNIIHTFEYVKSLVVGQAKDTEMEDKYIINTKCAFIEI
jgi:hypothetical protein